MVECTRCGREIESWDGSYYTRGMMCPTCFSESARRQAEKSAICTRCGLRIAPKDANLKLGTTLCNKCYEDVLKEQRDRYCAVCKKLITGASFERPDGSKLCLKCVQDQSPTGGRRQGIRVCDKCGRLSVVQYVSSDGMRLCPQCAPSHTGSGVLKFLTNVIGKLRR